MRACALLILLMGWVTAAYADERSASLSVELNTLSDVSGGCQITFLAENSVGADLESVVFETVLFDTRGAVKLLTLFDFGAIPADAPRVRQFVVPATRCGDLGRILINGVNTCTAPGLAEADCASGLTLKSRLDVELIG